MSRNGKVRRSLDDTIARRLHKLDASAGAHWIWCGSLVGGSRPQVNVRGENINARVYLSGFPAGSYVRPRCGVVRCVNPEHMEISTRPIGRPNPEWGLSDDAKRSIVEDFEKGQALLSEFKEHFTYEAIGAKHSITRERVRQIIAQHAPAVYARRFSRFGPAGIEGVAKANRKENEP